MYTMYSHQINSNVLSAAYSRRYAAGTSSYRFDTVHSEPSDSPFNTSEADLIYSVNVVNFQWAVFISDFMHMRGKTICEFSAAG